MFDVDGKFEMSVPMLIPTNEPTKTKNRWKIHMILTKYIAELWIGDTSHE